MLKDNFCKLNNDLLYQRNLVKLTLPQRVCNKLVWASYLSLWILSI